MKIGLFTDIHIGLESDNPFFHKENIKLANWIKEEFQKNKIKTIVILGDIFHHRERIVLESLHNAREFFSILNDFKIHIITGNHDCFYRDNSSVHSLGLLQVNASNISVYDKPTVIDLDASIAMIPWGTGLDDIPSADYVMGHFEIAGFEMQGTVCEKGLTGAELVKKAKHAVLSGHFHKPQVRAYGKREIHYLGSPYQHNFGEAGEDKFIYILDMESHELEAIKNEISPKHFYVKQGETDFGKYSNCIVKPVITDPDNQDEFMTKINSVSPAKVNQAEIVLENVTKTKETVEEFKSTNFHEDVKTFVFDIMEIDDNMKEDVVNAALELYESIN